MNPTTRIVGSIGIGLLIGSASSNAQNWTDNLYLHADVGPAFLQSAPTTIRTVTPSTFPFGTVQHSHSKAETDIRADLSVGYNLTKSFALEAEAGAIWNPDDNSNNYFYQIPTMLNAIYRIQLSDSWKAYVGAGAGAVISKTHSLFMDPALHTPMVLEDTDWSAGYQAEAGVKYAISRHIELDLGYKFLGVCGYDYRTGNIGVRLENVQIKDLFTHSAELSLTWKF